MKTSLGQFFWFHTHLLFYFWFGRFSLCYIQTELQVGMENDRRPPEPQATPLHWAWSARLEGQVGGGFLWTRSFTYRKRERERKLRIKLFDRYFSSFSQRAKCFLVLFHLLSLCIWSSSIVPPPKEHANVSLLAMDS